MRFSRSLRGVRGDPRAHRRLAAGIAAAVALLSAPTPRAHEIPNDVTIRAFVRPEGQRLRVVLRVPLAAMRDVDYPRRGAVNSGLLDISRADSTLRDAATLWLGDFLDVYEEGRKLPYPTVIASRASLQSDPSFASYDAALAHVLGPKLPDDTEFFWTQGLLDVLFELPIQSDRSHFALNPRFARLGIRTLTVVHYLPASGDARVFELDGDPGIVRLDPRVGEVVRQFGRLGVGRLLDGVEEMLLIVCLVLPFLGAASLLSVAGAFVAAYSLTLLAASGVAPDALWFRPLIATIAAAMVLYTSLEDIVGTTLDRRRVWAFACGLIGGFGFSFDFKQQLQFAGGHAISAAVAFDAGLTLGVLAVLAAFVPVFLLTTRYVVGGRIATIIVSALVAHSAWHWTVDRADLLRRFRIGWPTLDLAFWATAMRWAMLGVIAVGVYWLMFSVPWRSGGGSPEGARKRIA